MATIEGKRLRLTERGLDPEVVERAGGGVMRRATRGMGLAATIMLGALFVHPGRADAACEWRNGRPRCDLGGLRLLLGEPWGLVEGAPDGDLLTAPLASATTGLHAARAQSRRPYEVYLQSFSYDPHACRAIGQETYCQ